VDACVPGGKVEAEGGAVVHQFVAHLHNHSRALLLQVPPHHRHEDGLDVLYLLDQQFLAEPHCQFEAVGELGVPLTDNFHLLLAPLEPLDGLVVGVQQHGHSRSIEYHHRVLEGEGVAGQAEAFPPQLHAFRDHKAEEVEVLRLRARFPLSEDDLSLVLVLV
jgi:hypothetical protein